MLIYGVAGRLPAVEVVEDIESNETSQASSNLTEIVWQDGSGLPAVPPPVVSPPALTTPPNLSQSPFNPTPRQNSLASRLFGRPFATMPGTGAAAGTSLRQLSPPHMFGDNQDASCASAGSNPNQSTVLEHPGLGCFRLNISENNSAIPMDRVYFRYSHLHNASDLDGRAVGGQNNESFEIERFLYGVERQMFEGRMSVEVRLPFAYELTPNLEVGTINGVSRFDPSQDAYALTFKRVSAIAKFLLLETDQLVLSGGLGFDTPTAPDFRYRDRTYTNLGNTQVFLNYEVQTLVKDEIYEISPFLALAWTPKTNWFGMSFLQFDLPLNDADTQRTVTIYDSPNQTPGQDVVHEKFSEQALMRLNIGGGYWLVRRAAPHRLTGWAMSMELHYTTTLEDAQLTVSEFQVTSLPGFNQTFAGVLGNAANRVDVLNLVLGNTFEFNERTTIGNGFTLPLRDGADKPFDFEYIFQINHRF
ncbi:hypothetical protein GC163_00700 [bacterium]|nr:hypothetical protein [bacterium]